MYGIILILVLVVMGGAIAYIGDKLGSKVGKKKLSIFGLRPKHTSIIVTIITGILITSSTLGILTLASRNVRVALFGMEKLNRQIRETEDSLQTITLELSKVTAERAETVEALEKAQADFSAASADLVKSQGQIAELEEVKVNLEQAKNELNQRVAGLSIERESLEADVDRLKDLTEQLAVGMQKFRAGEIVYRAGEIIVNTILSNTGEHAKASGALSGILQQANQNILDHLGIKKDVEVLWIPQKEFEQAVNVIVQGDQDVIVRIVAAGNIVYGEPVRGHIELFPNRLVYQENQLIFTRDFDLPNGGEEKAEEVVIAFLKQVNIEAVQKGILPDPLSKSVGVMNGAQFYDIVNSIEPLNGRIRLTAYAGNDTNATGPLRLRVKVELLENQ